MPLKCKKEESFSLIEFVIVMALIAILASLIQPSLQKMIIHSMRIVCLNQMRQIHLASSSFAQDHDGNLPSQVRPNGTSHTIWVTEVAYQALKEYGLQDKQFVSPNLQDELNLSLNAEIMSRISGYSWLMGQTAIMENMEKQSIPTEERWVSATNLDDSSESLMVADLNEYSIGVWTVVAHPSWGDGQNFAGPLSNTGFQGVEPSVFGSQGGHVIRLDGSAQWKDLHEMQKWYTTSDLSYLPYLGWW